MLKKFLLISFVLCCMLNNILIVFAEDDSIYYDASEKLKRADIIIARTVDNGFERLYNKAQVTRAEFSGVILNALHKEIPLTVEKTYFQDCDIKDWYTPYINTLFELKIVSGYGDNNFKPKNIITNFEAITMIVRCLGYDNVKTENSSYPNKYIEVAENLNLFANTTINKTNDEAMTYGNMFAILINSMRCNVNNTTFRLWDYGCEADAYKKVIGRVKSINGQEYIVHNDLEEVKLTWRYEEDLSAYSDKIVSVWFIENENYVLDMICL